MNEAPDTRTSLILRLRHPDDAQAWSEFVALYQPVMYRLVRGRGLQHEDAVEVTQEVLTRVAKAVDRWDPDPNLGSFRGWLGRITRNMVISFLRSQQRRPMTSDDSSIRQLIHQKPDRESAEATAFDNELERQLFQAAARRARESFQDKTWQAFWRTAVSQEEVEHVARQLSMSRGAVYIARCRVMARIKELVQQGLEETQF